MSNNQKSIEEIEEVADPKFYTYSDENGQELMLLSEHISKQGKKTYQATIYYPLKYTEDLNIDPLYDNVRHFIPAVTKEFDENLMLTREDYFSIAVYVQDQEVVYSDKTKFLSEHLPDLDQNKAMLDYIKSEINYAKSFSDEIIYN